jgi:hypothetical protein
MNVVQTQEILMRTRFKASRPAAAVLFCGLALLPATARADDPFTASAVIGTEVSGLVLSAPRAFAEASGLPEASLLFAASAAVVVMVAEAPDAPGTREISLRDPVTGKTETLRLPEEHALARAASPGTKLDLAQGATATAVTRDGVLLAILPKQGNEEMYGHETLQ